MSEKIQKIFLRPDNLGNGIVLYNHQNSFYGQKVIDYNLYLFKKNKKIRRFKDFLKMIS